MEKKQYKCLCCGHVFNVSYAGIGETGYVDQETGEIWFCAASVVKKTCPVCYFKGMTTELEEVN